MFKVGDNVICKNAKEVFSLIENKNYIVEKINDNMNIIYVINDYNIIDWYSVERFKLNVVDERKNKLKKLYGYR